MVAKKSGEKKDVRSGVSSEKKTSTAKNVAKKTSIERTAIKKLKKEVKSVEKKSNVSLKNSTGGEVEAMSVKDGTTFDGKNDKNGSAKKEENKYSFLKSLGDEQEKSKGKIGEIKDGIARATGHRKRAIAKVACKEKSSAKLSISVNDLDYKKFFTKLIHQNIVCAPFALLGIKAGYVVNAEVFGGGKTGQADAMKLAISRCLSLLSEEYAKVLRKASFLTRDARKVEPKKAGLKKARKKEQFSKR